MENLPDLGEHLVIISPHDDDAVLGTGGLIKARSDLRLKTTVLILTDGSLGYSTPKEKDTIVKTRRAETAKCYESLGADVVFLGFPDMGLHPYRCWETPDGKEGAYQTVIAKLRELSATALLIPNPADRHPDHKAAYDIAKVAAFQASEPVAADLGKPIELEHVFCYAVWDRLQEETHEHQLTTEQLNAKKEALAAYVSQAKIIQDLTVRLKNKEILWKQK